MMRSVTFKELVERLHARRPGLRRDYAAGGHLSGVWGVWGAVWAALGRAGRIAEGLIRTASGSPAPGNGPRASEKAEPRRSPRSRRPGALQEGQRGGRGARFVLGSAGNVAEASESGLLLSTQIGAGPVSLKERLRAGPCLDVSRQTELKNGGQMKSYS